MEDPENCYGVSSPFEPVCASQTLYFVCNFRRSHMPEGVKSKSWQERMEKTQKEKAIKKLQAELKEEKQAEITRSVEPLQKRTLFSYICSTCRRRREITLERKKAAEERRRLEEDKAKVRPNTLDYFRQYKESFHIDGCTEGRETTSEGGENQEDQPLISLTLFAYLYCCISASMARVLHVYSFIYTRTLMYH